MSDLQPGDWVKFHNRITDKDEIGQLRFSYDTQFGKHWALSVVEKGTARVTRTSRSEKSLAKVEAPDGYAR